MPGTVAVVDFGVNRLVTLDDGSWFENPRFLHAGANDVAAASRRLARAKARIAGSSEGAQGAVRVAPARPQP
ncbi:hypothetical protein [Sphingomonas sp. PP-CC-3G-468]|uniref:hypothetical protein n=1 Tax=Sphingomonas sp. PP-CC-3G-468 TaxID=2135656 RepID=UPI00104667CE|nr:hypothetical protein [Sphingomonas sp. PP-CC-3G-468]